MSRISIGIVDDQPIFCEGMIKMLSSYPVFRVAGCGHSAADAVELAKREMVDVLVTDVYMSGDVFDAIAQIREACPNSKILTFTGSDRIDHAMRALEAGSNGCVLKRITFQEFVGAVEAILRGEQYITPSLAVRMIASLRKPMLPVSQAIRLSAREDQIVKLLLRGFTNKKIADQLRISEKTVKHYMTLLMQKFAVRNRLEVVIAAQNLAEYQAARSTSAVQ